MTPQYDKQWTITSVFYITRWKNPFVPKGLINVAIFSSLFDKLTKESINGRVIGIILFLSVFL